MAMKGTDSHSDSAGRTDAAIMNDFAATKGNDSVPLENLIRRHEALVLNELRRSGVRRSDADGVAANVWLTVWRLARNGRWDPNRAIHCKDPFVPLLKTICSSRANDFHRRATREHRRLARLARGVELHGDSWRDELASATSRRPSSGRAGSVGVPDRLAPHVAALPDRLRRPYELHAAGLTNRAIAGQVGCSWGEVSRRLKQAREALRSSAARGAE
jgi:DNA-directed RNA polymerase specialized sigma24 family protein